MTKVANGNWIKSGVFTKHVADPLIKRTLGHLGLVVEDTMASASAELGLGALRRGSAVVVVIVVVLIWSRTMNNPHLRSLRAKDSLEDPIPATLNNSSINDCNSQALDLGGRLGNLTDKKSGHFVIRLSLRDASTVGLRVVVKQFPVVPNLHEGDKDIQLEKAEAQARSGSLWKRISYSHGEREI